MKSLIHSVKSHGISNNRAFEPISKQDSRYQGSGQRKMIFLKRVLKIIALWIIFTSYITKLVTLLLGAEACS